MAAYETEDETRVSPVAVADTIPRMAPESHASAGEHRSHARGLVEVGIASVLWGTGGLAVQLIREHESLSPVTISAWRMTIAAVVLLVALLGLRRGDELLALARASPRQLLVVGVGTAAFVLARLAVEGFAPDGRFPAVCALLYVGAVGLISLAPCRRRAETIVAQAR